MDRRRAWRRSSFCRSLLQNCSHAVQNIISCAYCNERNEIAKLVVEKSSNPNLESVLRSLKMPSILYFGILCIVLEDLVQQKTSAHVMGMQGLLVFLHTLPYDLTHMLKDLSYPITSLLSNSPTVCPFSCLPCRSSIPVAPAYCWHAAKPILRPSLGFPPSILPFVHRLWLSVVLHFLSPTITPSTLYMCNDFLWTRAHIMSETPQILRPIPRRTFEITPASNESSIPPSPSPENTNPELLEAKLHGASPPSRTRSILNLTSSTLLGIYSPTGYEVSREEPSTPWGTGAQTPSLRQSVDGQRPSPLVMSWDRASPRTAFDRRRSGFRGLYLPLILRGMLLFVIGMAYGALITHLHDSQELAPVKVQAFNRHSWSYMTFWGLAGVSLGSLQPWIDLIWSNSTAAVESPASPLRRRGSSCSAEGDDNGERPGLGADWTPVVRSVGAFVGIAFAIVSL